MCFKGIAIISLTKTNRPNQCKSVSEGVVAYLKKGTELAHEGGQVPPVEQGCLKLEGDAKHCDDDICHGQIANVHVDHRVHPSTRI